MYTFLLRMTDTVTSQDIDLFSRDTLCKAILPVVPLLQKKQTCALEDKWRKEYFHLRRMNNRDSSVSIETRLRAV
jgi:hypothetical protein